MLRRKSLGSVTARTANLQGAALNSRTVISVKSARFLRLRLLFTRREKPENRRSDNGREFVSRNVREWLGRIGVKTLFIEPGSPWENGYCESFNSKLRDELLAGEQFSTLHEAKVLIEQWRRQYNERQ